MTKITLQEIMPLICETVKCPIKEGTRFYRDMVNFISISLQKKEKVTIWNFGTFKTHKTKERMGRNPKTGEECTISSRYVVKFTPSTYLKKETRKKS